MLKGEDFVLALGLVFIVYKDSKGESVLLFVQTTVSHTTLLCTWRAAVFFCHQKKQLIDIAGHLGPED